MEWVETVAKTVEEAKELALDQLGVDEQDAEFDILEEPRTGLFKRMRGEARVRARIKPRVPRPKQERKSSRRSGGASSAGNGATPRRGRSGGGQRSTKAATDTAAAAKAARAPRAAKATPAPAAQVLATDDVPITTGSEARGGDTVEEAVTVERQADIMEEFLEGLLGAFGTQGEVQRERIDDDTIELAVLGDDLGLLIGPKGLTLQAVQDLARTVVQRREPGTHQGRVRIDVSGYRMKRREALGRFVTGIAEEVARTGTAKALEPMGAADRKVAHDTVNDIDGVVTSSEGQEPRRWVVISPTA